MEFKDKNNDNEEEKEEENFFFCFLFDRNLDIELSAGNWIGTRSIIGQDLTQSSFCLYYNQYSKYSSWDNRSTKYTIRLHLTF